MSENQTNDLQNSETTPPDSEAVTSAEPQKAATSATPAPDAYLDPNRKKKNVAIPVILGVYAAMFIAFIIMGIMGNHAVRTAAVTLLTLSGCAEIITAIVFYILYKHRARYTCPVCGGIREKHSTYLTSWEEISKTTEPSQKTLYHKYRYTYVCPICGETREEIKQVNGGMLRVFSSGRIEDTRKPPHEDY